MNHGLPTLGDSALGEKVTEISMMRREERDFNGKKIDVIWRRSKPIESSEGEFPPLDPGTAVQDGIRVDRDVAVTLCDGVAIYTDVCHWKDKIPALKRIVVPAYITAGWSHLHLYRSLEAFDRISSRDNWSRVRHDR
ncbi:MAG: hypothetical protein ABSC36_05150 [Gaiellaceae bacterium]|jgi:predicted acyl esterase